MGYVKRERKDFRFLYSPAFNIDINICLICNNCLFSRTGCHLIENQVTPKDISAKKKITVFCMATDLTFYIIQ